MISIKTFDPDFTALLPETAGLLEAGNLVVHPDVRRITVHGSRSLTGGARPNSDIDLSLIVNSGQLPSEEPARETRLQSILTTTQTQWQGSVEVDLAALFEVRDGGLNPFRITHYDERICPPGAPLGFGLYKIQKGFQGYVDVAMLDIKLIYPCITVWRRPPT